jgi:hypothetical protein
MNLKNIIETLQIVSKYVDPAKAWCQAEHDELYLPLPTSVELDPKDAAKLEELGALKSDADCWSVFT